jgi:peptidylprolyl isomerase
MRSRYVLAAPLLAAGILAGCGANNSDTAHIVPPPQQSQTLTYTSSSAAAPTIITPTRGPLSTEPKITVPKTPAPTTLVKTDLISGTGAVAQSGDTITVNYVGALYKNGTVFDASWKRNQTLPVVLGAGQVIKGWDQGLVGMRVGGRRELIVPPSLGYGAKANGPIPANSTLIFVIDLLALTPATGATGVTGATAATGATGATG